MRKSLLLIALMALTMQAQTAKDPLKLVIGGENKYEYGGGYTTPVWIYTAPEDQLVSVRPNSTGTTIKVTYDGNAYSTNLAPSVKYNSEYLFIAQKDVPLYLNVTATASPVILDASASAYPYRLGTSTDDAIEIKTGAEAIFVPFREVNYKEVPVYLKYAATEEGALDLTFKGYVHDAYYYEGPDGQSIGITCKSQSGDYRTYIPVKPGVDYYVRLASSSAKMLIAELTHPTYGESPDYPIIITGTEAIVPAKAGKYYYEVTGTETGYAVVGSDVKDLDGSVTLSQTISSSNSTTVSDGTFDIRQKSTKGAHYTIVVDKKTDSSEPQKFNVKFELTQPYDDYTKGAPLTLGEPTTLPPYPNTYYYRISTPAEGAYMLTAAPAIPFTDANSSIKLFAASNFSNAKYIGDPDIICEVEAATDYILEVVISEADKRNSVTASVSELEHGDGASDPFIVKIGENSLPAGDSKYYLYEAEKSSWVVITPKDNSINAPVVKRLKKESAPEQTTTILRHNDGHRFEAEAGYSYLIRFTKVKEATSFVFAVPDYAQGETRDNPYPIDGDSFTVPSAPGTYWWSYVPARNGKLNISTDFKFDVVSSPTRENCVQLFASDGQYPLTSLGIDYTNEIFLPAKQNVDEGKTYLIKATSVSEQSGRTVTLKLDDLDPGETPAVAIDIAYDSDPFVYKLPVISSGRTSGKWYAIDLQAGQLTISAPTSVSFYFYKANDDNDYNTGNYMAYATTWWNSDYTNRYFGMKDKSITEPGKYLFVAYYIYAETDITFEGTALKVEASIGSVGADKEAEYTVNGNVVSAISPVTVYDLSGRAVASIAAGDATSLSPGAYIVRGQSSASKIMVK